MLKQSSLPYLLYDMHKLYTPVNKSNETQDNNGLLVVWSDIEALGCNGETEMAQYTQQ